MIQADCAFEEKDLLEALPSSEPRTPASRLRWFDWLFAEGFLERSLEGVTWTASGVFSVLARRKLK